MDCCETIRVWFSSYKERPHRASKDEIQSPVGRVA